MPFHKRKCSKGRFGFVQLVLHKAQFKCNIDIIVFQDTDMSCFVSSSIHRLPIAWYVFSSQTHFKLY